MRFALKYQEITKFASNVYHLVPSNMATLHIADYNLPKCFETRFSISTRTVVPFDTFQSFQMCDIIDHFKNIILICILRLVYAYTLWNFIRFCSCCIFDDKSTLVQVGAWCLNQWWSSFMTPYDVIRPLWVHIYAFYTACPLSNYVPITDSLCVISGHEQTAVAAAGTPPPAAIPQEDGGTQGSSHLRHLCGLLHVWHHLALHIRSIWP